LESFVERAFEVGRSISKIETYGTVLCGVSEPTPDVAAEIPTPPDQI
jgi:hypothetical protein